MPYFFAIFFTLQNRNDMANWHLLHPAPVIFYYSPFFQWAPDSSPRFSAILSHHIPHCQKAVWFSTERYQTPNQFLVLINNIKNMPRQSHSISIAFLWISINVFGIALFTKSYNKSFKNFSFYFKFYLIFEI